MVVHACNPSYSGDRGRRITSSRKVNKTLSQKEPPPKKKMHSGFRGVQMCKETCISQSVNCNTYLTSLFQDLKIIQLKYLEQAQRKSQ
jgi:hypothetical protein